MSTRRLTPTDPQFYESTGTPELESSDSKEDDMAMARHAEVAISTPSTVSSVEEDGDMKSNGSVTANTTNTMALGTNHMGNGNGGMSHNGNEFGDEVDRRLKERMSEDEELPAIPNTDHNPKSSNNGNGNGKGTMSEEDSDGDDKLSQIRNGADKKEEEDDLEEDDHFKTPGGEWTPIKREKVIKEVDRSTRRLTRITDGFAREIKDWNKERAEITNSIQQKVMMQKNYQTNKREAARNKRKLEDDITSMEEEMRKKKKGIKDEEKNMEIADESTKTLRNMIEGLKKERDVADCKINAIASRNRKVETALYGLMRTGKDLKAAEAKKEWDPVLLQLAEKQVKESRKFDAELEKEMVAEQGDGVSIIPPEQAQSWMDEDDDVKQEQEVKYMGTKKVKRDPDCYITGVKMPKSGRRTPPPFEWRQKQYPTTKAQRGRIVRPVAPEVVRQRQEELARLRHRQPGTGKYGGYFADLRILGNVPDPDITQYCERTVCSGWGEDANGIGIWGQCFTRV